MDSTMAMPANGSEDQTPLLRLRIVELETETQHLSAQLEQRTQELEQRTQQLVERTRELDQAREQMMQVTSERYATQLILPSLVMLSNMPFRDCLSAENERLRHKEHDVCVSTSHNTTSTLNFTDWRDPRRRCSRRAIIPTTSTFNIFVRTLNHESSTGALTAYMSRHM